MIIPQTLKGFRDFLPEEKRKRNFIVKKVVEIFERFGFEPVETPTVEYASLLLGKYGKEADRLIYTFTDKGGRKLALRYDQTVPTARLLAQNQNPDTLPKILRRYQIQNVFRADKPQKGRYREFTQCDIDIFGSSSPIADAEILACTYFSFKNIGYPEIILKLNDRKTLFNTLKPFESEKIRVLSIIQTVDKLDKKSEIEVLNELIEKGLSEKDSKTVLNKIQAAEKTENLDQIINFAINLGVPENSIEYHPTLARGLDYYTGMIFEVILPEFPVGSFGGGGRYDKLIGQLSGVSIVAVGIAFGFDRMVEAADDLSLIPSETIGTKVLVTIFDKSTQKNSFELVKFLRQAKINTELIPDSDSKLDKQLKYADRKGISFVAILGPEEVKNGQVTLKNLKTKTQQTLKIDSLPDAVKHP